MKSKAAYLEYLKGEHWGKLRTAVLERDGHKCTKCTNRFHLQAHHLFYRRFWEDAQPADLVTLCRKCHESVHEIKLKAKTAQQSKPKPAKFSGPISTLIDLHAARADRLISREEFLRLKPTLQGTPDIFIGTPKIKAKRKRRIKYPVSEEKNLKPQSSPKTRTLCFTRHFKWANRGRSSN